MNFLADLPNLVASQATGQADLLTLLTPVIAYLVADQVNRWLPRVPNALVPIIAALVGPLTAMLDQYETGHSANLVTSLALGIAATGIHQVGAQLKKSSAAPAAPSVPVIPQDPPKAP